MIQKEITASNEKYIFQFKEDTKTWYLGNNEIDIFEIGQPTNISLKSETIDWEIITKFLQFLSSNNEKERGNILKSNAMLISFFRELYVLIAPDINYDQIYFSLCNINYLGFKTNGNEMLFQYELNYNLESKVDPDLFSYESWNVSFLNNEIIGISKS